MSTIKTAERTVAGTVEELLRGVERRAPMKTADSKSGSAFERVVIDGERFVVKYLHVDDDWVQRATGDVVCRAVRVWHSRLLERVATIIDDAIVGCAVGLGRNGWGAAMLLRDVGEWLVPEGDATLPLEQHLGFLRHMAAFHAAFWDFEDEVGLLPVANRYLLLSPLMAATEATIRSEPDPVPKMVPSGWRRFARAAPRAARIVLPLLDDPTRLVEALDRSPATLVHSDWKAGNLGSLPDGRTILLDWAWPGRAPACVDLAWYLAVNCERLPQSKEQAIEHYRRCLEDEGIDTSEWWNAQLELSLLGALVLLGWSKSGPELDWWDERVAGALAYLE